MNFHEYQAKELFAQYGIAVPAGKVAKTPDEAVEAAKALGGEPAVAGVREVFLVSISLGAVFCGAMTYIGNGPNFMVKAIAEDSHIHMPGFFAYIGWSLEILFPVFILDTLLFYL